LDRRSQNAIVYSAYHGGQVVVRGVRLGRVGVFDTAMFDAAADCLATCTHYASAGDNAYTNKDIDSNMDDYTIEDSNGSTSDSDTYIYGDCYGTRSHKHGDLYPKFYTKRDEDTGRAGHAAKDGAKRTGNSRTDPDHNGDK
jgi:hypothetical protein